MLRNTFNQACHRAAFTLIEISIVLVIIGLLVGGVVLGAELQRNAGLTSLISDAQKIRSEMESFKERYDYYPGDFPNAQVLWGSMTAPACDTTGNTSTAALSSTTPVALTCNGRGNGVVGQFFVDAAQFTTTGADMRELREKFYVWQHLALAGYLRGKEAEYSGYSVTNGDNNAVSPGINVPRTEYSDALGFMIEYWPTRNTSVLATRAFPVSGNIGHLFSWSKPGVGINTTNLITSINAKSIDAKADDGLPFSGNIFAHGRSGDGVDTCTSGTDYDVSGEFPCGQYMRNFLE